MQPRQPDEIRYTAQDCHFGFAFEGQRGFHAFASDRLRPFTTKPNSLAFVRAGCDVMSNSAMGGEYMVISGSALAELPQLEQFNELISISTLEQNAILFNRILLYIFLLSQHVLQITGAHLFAWCYIGHLSSAPLPYSYIIDRRLALSRRELIEKVGSLDDVALGCGFASLAHMTSVFRDWLGLSLARFVEKTLGQRVL